jgi:hypothetical protein
MMAKDPALRYPTPQAVADALEPWSQQPIAAPPDEEMPRLSLAAMGTPGTGEGSGPAQLAPPSTGMASPTPRKNWQVPATPSPRIVPPPTKTPAPAPAAPHHAAATVPTRPVSAPSTNPPRPKPNGDMERTFAPAASATPARAPVPSGKIFGAPRTAALPSPEPIADDEAPRWDQLSPDTDDLTARADTAPRSAHKGPISRRLPKHPGTKFLDPAKRAQFLLVMGVIAFFIVLGIVVALVISFFLGSKPKTTTENEKPTKTLIVNSDGSLRTIKEALKIAQQGDVIRVNVPVKESVFISEKRYCNLTIEAAADASRPISWSVPANAGETTRLIDIRNIEGLCIRGFTLDGGDKVNHVISLHGNCPGLKLEDLKIKGFKQNGSGILITNCAGMGDRPVTLSRITFIGDEPPKECGVLFTYAKNIKDPPLNHDIRLQNCNVEGGVKQLRFVPDPLSNDESTIVVEN